MHANIGAIVIGKPFCIVKGMRFVMLKYFASYDTHSV